MAGGRAAARPAGARSASRAPRRLLALLALQCCGALRVPAPPARRAADPQLVLAPVPARDGSVELARAAALYRRVSEGDSYAATQTKTEAIAQVKIAMRFLQLL